MRARRMLRFVGCVGWGIFLIGCERRPHPQAAATPEAASTSQPEPARPTTQELMNGPMKKLILPGMQLSLQVPSSWKIQLEGSLTFLQGPTPTDGAMIELAQRESMRPDQLDVLLTGIKREQEQHPETIKQAEMHDFGNMKVIEQFSVTPTTTNPKIDAKGEGVVDAQGNLVTVTITPVHWKLTVLVPFEKVFTRYELNFIDLTDEQYTTDKEFLKKIVSSLRYKGAINPATNP